jgi:hypothetical protein
MRRKQEFSFLKKRNKKLLNVSERGPIRIAGIGPDKQTDKSLFASFSSEKEESSFPTSGPHQ